MGHPPLPGGHERPRVRPAARRWADRLAGERIVDRWPTGRHLDFLHAPLAAGVEPPPLDREFYAPLRGLRLPAQTRFIAGFVHEERSPAEQRKRLRELDALIGRPVDVACSCGLGRRSREDALQTIEQARALVDVLQPRARRQAARRKVTAGVGAYTRQHGFEPPEW